MFTGAGKRREWPLEVKASIVAEYYSGVIYVFRAKRADRIKLVWWDGTKREQATETSIRRHFIAACREDYANTAKEFNDATGKLKNESDALAALQETARELRQRIRTHGPAAGVINKLIAAYLGHGELTINPVEDGYELQRHGTPITGVPSDCDLLLLVIDRG